MRAEKDICRNDGPDQSGNQYGDEPADGAVGFHTAESQFNSATSVFSPSCLSLGKNGLRKAVVKS